MIYRGKIDDEFEGFDENKLFKMSNGSFWIQARYRYWYHYAYRPDVVIHSDGAQYFMAVAGESVEVQQIHDVVESRIAGKFEGWRGNSEYKLQNSQVWKQSRYKYQYKYAYRPEAIVYRAAGPYVMRVAGTEAEVKRVR